MIAGINSKNEPFIAASDLIGCLNFAKDFVVSGTASEKLFGMAEGLWEPDLVSGLSCFVLCTKCHRPGYLPQPNGFTNSCARRPIADTLPSAMPPCAIYFCRSASHFAVPRSQKICSRQSHKHYSVRLSATRCPAWALLSESCELLRYHPCAL